MQKQIKLIRSFKLAMYIGEPHSVAAITPS
jgi:hypothetical protein